MENFIFYSVLAGCEEGVKVRELYSVGKEGLTVRDGVVNVTMQ